jgi:acetyltransferase-like isoleucine patch superfamily enzyme
MNFPGIEAAAVKVGRDVMIGAGSRVLARDVTLYDGAAIEEGVTICCDRLVIGSGVRIGARTRIISPEIELGAACSIGAGFEAELNEYLRLGDGSDIGRGVRMTGQGVVAGEHLWMTDAVLVGGGGARGPRSYLSIGDRSAVMDRCFINLSEPVSIGSDTALSNGVTILTHSLWQPALFGGTTIFAPSTIGSRNILYVNAIIAPGVTTGDDVTVAAGALVLHDVPDGAMAIGNPARIIKTTPPAPRTLEASRKDALMRDILRTYVETVPVKGGTVEEWDDPDLAVVTVSGLRESIRYLPLESPSGGPADITVGFDAAPGRAGRCHFDVAASRMSGEPTLISEDFRDYLRRRTIRIFTDRPFQPLPPANVARLRAWLRTS